MQIRLNTTSVSIPSFPVAADPPATPRKPAAASAPPNSIDRVEVTSTGASSSDEAANAVNQRDALVARIRDAIAAGTYLTRERIDRTVDRLYAEINTG